MKYDFIEIGVSDFRMLAEGSGRGISVEPVKEYFDRIPQRDGLIRLNCAISSEEGVGSMYYYPRDLIEKYNLPAWFAGCHSFGYIREDLTKYLPKGVSHSDVLRKQSVDVIRLKDLFDRCKVKEVGFLKVDCEGHDYVIIKDLFEMEEMPLIHKIQYESNYLLTDGQREDLEHLWGSNGYKGEKVIYKGNEDTILTLI